MKKGQIEMVGLVIIVVLIVIVGLFAFGFMLRRSPTSLKEFDSIKANNLMNALVKSKEELMISCCELDQGSCSELNDFIVGEVNQSIDKNFYFELKNDEVECYSYGICLEGVSSSTVFIRSRNNIYNSRVMLC